MYSIYKNKKGVRNMRTVYRKNGAVIDVLIAAVVATALAVGVIATVMAVQEEPPTCVITAVAAKKNDTLWGISEKYCPDHTRTGEVVSIISEMNGGIADLKVGQVIYLPFKEGK